MPSYLTGRFANITPKRVNVLEQGTGTGANVYRPTLTTKVIASGGNRVRVVNGYVYHWFTSTGDLTVQQGGNLVEILMVGGGGGAGGASGQSGGGGGSIWIRNATLTSGTYTMTIGAGGAGASRGSGSDTTITKGGTVQVLGDQDFGGLFIARAGGGGGGAGTHGSANDPKSQGGGAGGRQSGLTSDIGFGNKVLALRPLITNAGSGYTSAPTITIPAPNSAATGIPNSTTATVTAEVSGGSVTRINITNPGYGYSWRYPDVDWSFSPTISGGGGSGLTVNWDTSWVVIGGHSGPTANSNGGTSLGGGGAGNISSYPSAGSTPVGLQNDMFDGKFGVTGLPGPSNIWPSSNAENNFIATGSATSNAASPVMVQFQNSQQAIAHTAILTGGAYYYGYYATNIWNSNGGAGTDRDIRYSTSGYGYGGFAGVYTGGDGLAGVIIVRYPA
jgi:hypothetical protein